MNSQPKCPERILGSIKGTQQVPEALTMCQSRRTGVCAFVRLSGTTTTRFPREPTTKVSLPHGGAWGVLQLYETHHLALCPNTTGLCLPDHCISIARGGGLRSSKVEMSSQGLEDTAPAQKTKFPLYETMKLTLIQRDHQPSN